MFTLYRNNLFEFISEGRKFQTQYLKSHDVIQFIHEKDKL